MSLAERIEELVRAAFSDIWVRSHEHDDAEREFASFTRPLRWTTATWDIDRGMSLIVRGNGDEVAPLVNDPLSAIKWLNGRGKDEDQDDVTILILRNFHRFLGSAEVVQAIDTVIANGKVTRTFVVILSPVVQIPVELERQFVVVEHDLPDRVQLEQIAEGIAMENGELPEGDDLGLVLDAASGLTRMEAENAFSLSLVRHGKLAPESLWELKTGALKKSGLLTLNRGGETFADLGGLGALKEFSRKALEGSRLGSVQARGVLLLGVPGVGKSAFAKALGNEIGRPTLTLDIGALMGSLVGQTEERTRQALKIADAMAPCILFVDEIEKALSGSQSSGQTDSGVSARLLGTLLSWLNDHESDVFVVATANDVSKLPPELTRAERFDGIFFLDLPGSAEKDAVWKMYIKRFDLNPDQPKPGDRDWTGAEIKSCCRLAALLDVPLIESATNIVPIATTAGESSRSCGHGRAGVALRRTDRGSTRATLAARPRLVARLLGTRRITEHGASIGAPSRPPGGAYFVKSARLQASIAGVRNHR